jgi:hypothetical protein
MTCTSTASITQKVTSQIKASPLRSVLLHSWRQFTLVEMVSNWTELNLWSLQNLQFPAVPGLSNTELVAASFGQGVGCAGQNAGPRTEEKCSNLFLSCKSDGVQV